MNASHPFFIVGSARSGTTLLRLMLDAHPDVSVPPEARIITALWKGREEVEVDEFLRDMEAHKSKSEVFRGWGLDPAAVREQLGHGGQARYSDLIEACYLAYAGARGKRRWGVKTPGFVERIPFISGLFPQARFIHLIRDGRDVALSYSGVPFGPKTVAKAARLWSRRVSAGRRYGADLGPARYLEMRYEEFVSDDATQLKRLCDFLDLPFDEAMLNPSRQASTINPKHVEQNRFVTERPRTGVRSWQSEMPDKHIEVFEAVAGSLLSELGYERGCPNPGFWARARAMAALSGLPVDRIVSSGPAAGAAGNHPPDQSVQ